MKELKADIRQRIMQLRDSLSATDHARKSIQICHHARYFIHTPRKVCVYIPFRSELNLMPWVENCWQQGVEVYAPKVNAEDRTMQLYRIDSEEDLEQGAWGILEPKPTLSRLEEEAWISLDTIIVPGIAFDRQGGRMGYGGGFYDRLMDRLKQSHVKCGTKMPIRVAMAFQFQMVDHVPMEPHDFHVDGIITEEEMISITM